MATKFNIYADKDHWKKAIATARLYGDMSLAFCFRRLRNLAGNDGVINISQDGTPHGFGFYCESKSGYRINGGILFHGYPEFPDVEANPIAVTVDDAVGWRLHT